MSEPLAILLYPQSKTGVHNEVGSSSDMQLSSDEKPFSEILNDGSKERYTLDLDMVNQPTPVEINTITKIGASEEQEPNNTLTDDEFTALIASYRQFFDDSENMMASDGRQMLSGDDISLPQQELPYSAEQLAGLLTPVQLEEMIAHVPELTIHLQMKYSDVSLAHSAADIQRSPLLPSGQVPPLNTLQLISSAQQQLNSPLGDGFNETQAVTQVKNNPPPIPAAGLVNSANAYSQGQGSAQQGATLSLGSEEGFATQELIESGQGNKAQQHDRLMAAVSAMRQEQASERRSLDMKNPELSGLLTAAASLEAADEYAWGSASQSLTSLAGPQASSSIHLPLQHPRWGNEMSEKVIWMVNSQIKEAEIKLNPGSLGSIDIKISLKDDQANVVFNVQSVQAKEALELALPRLREMLAEAGVHLNQADFSDHNPQQGKEQQTDFMDRQDQRNEGEHVDEVLADSHSPISLQQGVDLYI